MLHLITVVMIRAACQSYSTKDFNINQIKNGDRGAALVRMFLMIMLI